MIVLPPRSVDECLFHFSAIARTSTDRWAKEFATSILRQSRRKGWRPTDRQLGLMRKLVSELFTHADAESVAIFERER